MNYKRILFNYVFHNEKHDGFLKLVQAQQKLSKTFTKEQKKLFDEYSKEYNDYYLNRIYYYFCQGIRINIK